MATKNESLKSSVAFCRLLCFLGTISLTVAGEAEFVIKPRIAIITSDNLIDVLDLLSGQIVNTTRITGIKGHPYGIGLNGKSLRILSQQNKKFHLSQLTPRTLELESNSEILSDKGPFQKIQIISFFQDEIFMYDETLQSIFRWNSTENLFESLLSVEQRVTAMDVDFCHQYLFWSTMDTIHRLSLSTGVDEILVNDLSNLRALAVDRYVNRIFWISTNQKARPKNVVQVESSDLNGQNKKLHCQTLSNQEVVIRKMVVGPNGLYMADWKNRIVWKLDKTVSAIENKECDLIRIESSSTLKPVDLSLYDPQMELCHEKKETFFDQISNLEQNSPPVVQTEKPVLVESPCFNYCLQPEDHDDGALKIECHVTSIGIPVCSCPFGYQGKRCQINVCANFCLNGGICKIEANFAKPVCKCLSNFTGWRCQLTSQRPVNESVIESSLLVDSNAMPGAESCNYFFAFVACLISSTVLALTLVSVVLCFVCRRKSSSPAIIIKKSSSSRTRVFSSSSSKGRPHRSGTSTNDFVDSTTTTTSVSQPVTCPNGVILDLEDCCQMTLCEKPCAEAIFRKPTQRKNRTHTSKDVGGDTDALLDNETLS